MARTEQREKQRGGITGKGWLPGQSGNPGGRPKKLPISDALREILDDPEKARAYVLAALKHAIKSGSASHFKEINDRVEGSIAQRVEHTGEDGEPIQHTIRFGAKEKKPDER